MEITGFVLVSKTFVFSLKTLKTVFYELISDMYFAIPGTGRLLVHVYIYMLI